MNELRTQRAFEVFLALSVALIFTINHFGNSEGWFHAFWWMDVVMHLAGGIVLGIFFVYYFTIRTKTLPRIPTFSTLLFAIGFTAFIGIAWEWYEFLADVFRYHKYTYDNFPGFVHYDTLTDLVNDLLGGLGGAFFALQKIRPTTKDQSAS